MFGQRDKRDFTGQLEKVRDGTFGIGTVQKYFGTGHSGSGQFKNFSGRDKRDRDNKKVCPAGL